MDPSISFVLWAAVVVFAASYLVYLATQVYEKRREKWRATPREYRFIDEKTGKAYEFFGKTDYYHELHLGSSFMSCNILHRFRTSEYIIVVDDDYRRVVRHASGLEACKDELDRLFPADGRGEDFHFRGPEALVMRGELVRANWIQQETVRL